MTRLTTTNASDWPQKGSPLWHDARRLHNRKKHGIANKPCAECLEKVCKAHSEELAAIAYGDYGDD